MTIKSLLLGSAAVLVAVTGARAADAIVVEPEPVEYVRICDAYGAGWFYIPGTETCLKFDGDVRVEYMSVHFHDDVFNTGDSTHDVRYRARLNVRANNETEYGTLASRIRFAGQPGGASGPHSDATTNASNVTVAGTFVDWATISLAGFKTGFADDYWTTNTGYGYYGDLRNDGIYDYSQSMFFEYTYAANGLSATIGVQSQFVSFEPTGSRSGTAGQPDVYAGFNYSANNLTLAGTYVYDSSAGDGAYKLRADYDFGSGMMLGGWFMDDNGDTDYVHGHAWGVTGQVAFSEKLQLVAGYSEFDETSVLGDDTGQRNYTVGLMWTPVPGLRIVPEFGAYINDDETINNDTNHNFGFFNIRATREF